MKRVGLMLVLIAACLSATVGAQENPLHVGVKAGKMYPDAGDFDDASNVGLLLGYTFSRSEAGVLSLETEYTHNLSEGNIAGGGDWRAETIALYGAYRTEDRVYLKARAGALRQDVKCQGTARSPCGADTGFSFGAGVGWRLNRKVGFEFEYTALDDVGFLSFGYFTHF